MFNINATADGTSDMGTVVGQAGTFTEGMSFSYNGDNGWMDHIEAIAPAIKIFNNQSPLYGTGVAYDGGSYKTIGTAHEFGGLQDGTSPSTKEELMSAYLAFLGISQSLQAVISSNATFACIEDIIEFYDLSVGGAISWEWEFEGGSPATSTIQNPLVAYFNPGVFDVILTVSDGTDTNKLVLEDYITVSALPESAPSPIGPVSICASSESSFYNTTGISGISEYNWVLEPSDAGTLIVTDLNAIIIWEDGFLGDVTLQVAGENDCGTGVYSEPIDITRYLPEVTLVPFEWGCIDGPAFELTGGMPVGKWLRSSL